MPEDFATVAELAAFMQETLDPTDPTAILMLSIASGDIRDYLDQTITQVVDDVVILSPIEGAYVMLPQLPVTEVSLIETLDDDGTWSTVSPNTVSISMDIGMIAASPSLGVSWPSKPNTWRVTYTHGFTEIPPALKGVCLGVAARNYATPPGVQSERVGTYSAKYESFSDGFSPLEKAVLGRYLPGRIA